MSAQTVNDHRSIHHISFIREDHLIAKQLRDLAEKRRKEKLPTMSKAKQKWCDYTSYGIDEAAKTVERLALAKLYINRVEAGSSPIEAAETVKNGLESFLNAE